MARALYEDETHSVEDICKTLGISRATLYRAINLRAVPDDEKRDVGTNH